MTPAERKALQLLVAQWNSVIAHLSNLNLPGAKPDDPYAIFELSGGLKKAGQIDFVVKPVTFSVPEHATDVTPNTYVVVRARISLDEAAAEQKVIKTVDFATEVGYFKRSSGGELSHVYGAHFDLSVDDVGHPLFHSQMHSYGERASFVRDHFEIDGDCVDHVAKVSKTIRVPTAQMDVFAFLMQMTADHLLSSKSTAEELATFNDLRESNKKMKGAAYLWPAMEQAAACMRGVHWYK